MSIQNRNQSNLLDGNQIRTITGITDFKLESIQSSDVWTKFVFSKPFSKITLERQIRNFLKNSGNCGKTRTQICDVVKAPRTTVYDILDRMSVKGKIEIDHRHFKGKRGRPQTLFFLKGVDQGNRR